MTTYQGMNGRYTIIEPCRASGGEGEIFDIRGKNDLVLKRLDGKHRTTTREKKLEAMIRAGVPQQLLNQLTWPVDIVYDQGKFIGYVMPALHRTEDLNAVYSPQSGLTLKDRITVAMNLCVPVHELHQLGQYVGDGNPENICVDSGDLTVTFVDTDSYTIHDRSSGRIYPCIVGLNQYLAPEIQNALKQYGKISDLPEDAFNEYTDRFWLAVHIFALLMNGTHPFAVCKGSNVSIPHMSVPQKSISMPQPENNICNGFFPHTMKRSGLDIPMYCPKFSYLPAPVQNLFIRAFVDGHRNPSARPSAEEWYMALEQMKRNLTSGIHCGDRKHQYPSSASFCPWCELSSRNVPKPPVRTPGNTSGYGTNGYTSGNRAASGTTGTGAISGGGAAGKPRRSNSGCLSLLGGLLAALLSFALLMALPVACTANMIDIHRSQEAARQEANRQQLEELREQMEASQQVQNSQNPQDLQADTPAPYDSGMQADGTWIHPHDGQILQANDAEYLELRGSVSDEMPETEFWLEPGLDGSYTIETAVSDLPLYVYLYDEEGCRVASYISEKSGDCVSLNMEAGKTYTLKAEQRFSGAGNFQLRWWTQKPTGDLTNYGATHDRIEFHGQENNYLFRCSASKEYRFCFTELAEDMRMNIYVYDTSWNLVTSSYNVIEGYGPYADLQVGQEYYIRVNAYSGGGDYTLAVQQIQ